MAISESQHSIAASDGKPIKVYQWKGSEPARGVVQIAHGMGEHPLRYRDVAQALVLASREQLRPAVCRMRLNLVPKVLKLRDPSLVVLSAPSTVPRRAGMSLLKEDMVSHELKWFCSNEAYLEYKARCQNWLT